ncbi:putative peptidyl-tRNA hydrolase PTRHD1 [Convolutriloba macropyga]|uniref:putative peptidyl-tRNA hydrolase PTRHD1 n=1 Tax=Convolutriloba macropyga TaxID=536237 RepID=UPI003F51EC4C
MICYRLRLLSNLNVKLCYPLFRCLVPKFSSDCAIGDMSGGGGLVQYLVIRSDLKWSKGELIDMKRALVAQACHASTAIIHLTYSHTDTQTYLEDLDNMHKVVLKCELLSDLTSLSELLKEKEIDHKLWIEQPENYATCLAIRPMRKEEVFEYVKDFKLFR